MEKKKDAVFRGGSIRGTVDPIGGRGISLEGEPTSR